MNAVELNFDAIKFFKNNGLLKSKETIKMSAHALVDCGDGSYFHINQLKRLVNSCEMVAEHGSIERAMKYADSPYVATEIKEVLLKAIADVESVGGGV